MAKVVDIEGVRVDRLAADLLPAIPQSLRWAGMLKVSNADIDDIARWRRAARACARSLGVSCSTSVSADGSFVWVVDTSPVTFPDQVRERRTIDQLCT
ncbi:MAG TPA: hypothetical protein VFJ85_19535 [Acidimicrobiales bacterium]|nr:hypothetical protein [Acidimicrobiales bacterium]